MCYKVTKPLLETSRKGYLAAISASSYSYVSLLKHFVPIMNPGTSSSIVFFVLFIVLIDWFPALNFLICIVLSKNCWLTLLNGYCFRRFIDLSYIYCFWEDHPWVYFLRRSLFLDVSNSDSQKELLILMAFKTVMEVEWAQQKLH